MTNKLLENQQHNANASELGRKSDYDPLYNPERLFPIPRAPKREELGLDSGTLPFSGYDIWNHYEVSWLNQKGKPVVAIAEVIYDCSSPFLIESKSLKLYFNSLNNTVFDCAEDVAETIKHDIEARVKTSVFVAIQPLNRIEMASVNKQFAGVYLDELDIECSAYTVNPDFLSVHDNMVEETLHSDLLKSNCLVTNQPDWGSIQIHYQGHQINHAGLLQYLISFRNHNEFHEQCIERIFMDLLNVCKPKELTVYGRYTRRGGLDINPYRSTQSKPAATIENIRLVRQ